MAIKHRLLYNAQGTTCKGLYYILTSKCDLEHWQSIVLCNTLTLIILVNIYIKSYKYMTMTYTFNSRSDFTKLKHKSLKLYILKFDFPKISVTFYEMPSSPHGTVILPQRRIDIERVGLLLSVVQCEGNRVSL